MAILGGDAEWKQTSKYRTSRVSVYGDSEHVTGTVAVSSQMPRVPQAIKEEGLEALAHTHRVYGEALRAPVLGELLPEDPEMYLDPTDAHLLVMWKPRHQDLRVEVKEKVVRDRDRSDLMAITTVKKEGSTVRELLSATYDTVGKRNDHKEVALHASAEIDSDWDACKGTRRGYMTYEKVLVTRLGEKRRALGVGRKTGSYPGEVYDSDLLAFEVSPDRATPKKLEEQIERSTYFENSLLVGMADGRLSGDESGPGRKVAERVRPRIADFVAQRPGYDQRFISLATLRPVVAKTMLYKPECAAFLAETI